MIKPVVPNTMARWRLRIPAVALAALLVAGCAQQTIKSQAFSRIDDLKTELKRGVSTKADVLLLLGEPDGTGALGGFERLRDAAFKGKGPAHAWFYESFKSTIGLDLQHDQNVLLVFFEGDVFIGFFWFSNTVKGQMK